MINRFKDCFTLPPAKWIALWVSTDGKARYSRVSTEDEKAMAIRLFDATLYSADRRLRAAGIDMLIEDYCESFCFEQV